ncbi:hypothetical protein BDZ94DRAFT_1313938 [Collybia nuda]|uniref:F-box domain-containing protein n=1 Tax=Collybia nuda TaxID=64659 RepID=A0A9P5XU11_9AGAR|nr:hypothetical protein BDZ94DRAFT_1313938 [Collybia nuda]
MKDIAWSSNELPPDVGKAMLYNVLRDLSTRRVDIARLKRRQTLHVEENETQGGVSFQAILPPEILAKIFVESLDCREVVVPSPQRSSVPWSLGQVCSTWRAISRAEPLLWSRITMNKTVNPGYKYILSLVDDILVGCGGQGRIEVHSAPSGSEEWLSLLSLMSAHPIRLRALDLVLDDTCFKTLLRPISVLRNLETLSISYGNIRSPPVPNILLFYGFSAAINLRSVTIQFCLFPDATDLCGKMLPWANLTGLSLLGTSATSALVILGHCSSLVTLSLDIRRSGYEFGPPSDVVQLRYLKSISISMNDAQSAHKLLSSLVLPSLSNITIRDCYLEEGWLHKSGIALILEQSACRINSFRTQGLSISDNQLIAVMRALPALTELFIAAGGPITDYVLSSIVDEGLVPELHTFQGLEFPSIHSAIKF